jgi:hypothetical protein
VEVTSAGRFGVVGTSLIAIVGIYSGFTHEK